MSYMAILKCGRNLKRNITVFGQSPQICGDRLFKQLLSCHRDEHWEINAETCRLFRVGKVAPGIESRDEIHGAEKTQALRLMSNCIAS